MKKYKLISVVILAILFSGCRKDFPTSLNPNEQTNIPSWAYVFDSFWTGMNYNYVFWDIDPTDWDKVYTDYMPLFEELDINNPKDTEKAYALFRELTSTLIDHHFSLSFSDGTVISPATQELMTRDYYHNPISDKDLERIEISNIQKGRIKNYIRGSFDLGEENGTINVASYDIDNGIIYFRFNQYALTNLIETGEKEEKAYLAFKNYIDMLENTSEIRGVIIDVRSNGGGDTRDLDPVLGAFVSRDHHFAYTRSKNGMGRLDYTPWIPFILHSAQNEREIKAPVVMLTDIWSGSMSELTTMAALSLPNGCSVGERTYGAHGPLVSDFKIYYAGSFGNGFFSVRTSTLMNKDLNGNKYEGIGITPTIESLFNKQQFESGNDTQLERALQYIETGN